LRRRLGRLILAAEPCRSRARHDARRQFAGNDAAAALISPAAASTKPGRCKSSTCQRAARAADRSRTSCIKRARPEIPSLLKEVFSSAFSRGWGGQG
jgi:hypothetical protein